MAIKKNERADHTYKFYTDCRKYLSTEIRISLYSHLPKVDSYNVLDLAYAEFFRIGQTYTRFDKHSELGKLNRSAGTDSPFRLSEEFLYLLDTAFKLAASSSGAFDPTVLDLLELHGYKSTFVPKEIVAQRKSVTDIKKYASRRKSWQDVRLDTEAREISLPKGVRIDLGSIGKGHAIDCAANIFTRNGIDNFIIDAGGDIYAGGQNKGTNKPWTTELITINSGRKLSLGVVELTDQALASSGSWARKVGDFQHLLDPKSGLPSNESLQTFVIADKAIWADGLATLLFLTGPESLDYLAKNYHADGFAGLIITSENRIFANENFPVPNGVSP